MSADPRHLADFEGVWTLSRTIAHADGTRAAFEGRAIWSPACGGLDYCETGQLRINGGAPVTAEQRHFWSGTGHVHFADGRYFHQVPLGGGASVHWCDPDRYDVHYDFTQWPRFSVVWRVKGPRKDYEMTSLYAPSG
jgi:hypothetical protein